MWRYRPTYNHDIDINIIPVNPTQPLQVTGYHYHKYLHLHGRLWLLPSTTAPAIAFVVPPDFVPLSQS